MHHAQQDPPSDMPEPPRSRPESSPPYPTRPSPYVSPSVLPFLAVAQTTHPFAPVRTPHRLSVPVAAQAADPSSKAMTPDISSAVMLTVLSACYRSVGILVRFRSRG